MAAIDIVFDAVTKRGLLHGDASAERSVLCIGCQLNIGDIRRGVDSDQRKTYLCSLSNDLCDEEAVDEMHSEICEDLKLLDKAVCDGAAFRVWRNLREPHSACGFAYFCDRINAGGCAVSVVDLPDDVSSWALLSTEEREKRRHETAVDAVEIEQYALLWQRLKKENAPLRAVVDGRLCSVTEDYYDSVMWDAIPESGVFFEKEIVGSIVRQEKTGGVLLDWYSYRLHKLAQNGDPEIVPFCGADVVKREVVFRKASSEPFTFTAEDLMTVARATIDRSCDWSNDRLPAPLVYVLLSAKNNLYVVRDDDVNLLQKMLKNADDTAIDRLVTMWRDLQPDLPSADARETLLALNSKNADTQLLLSNGVRTVRECMP